MGNELFSKDKTGKKFDHHLHDEKLSHQEEFAKMAIERNVKKGMPRDKAVKLFGVKK